MSKFIVKVEHRPVLGTQQVITYAKMKAMLKDLPVEWKRIKLNDNNFYVPSYEDWGKIIYDLQPRIPGYIRDKRDCEFMAAWYYVHVCEDFEINTMAMVEGYADCRGKGLERHGWNIITEGKAFYQFEPQTGILMDIDDPKYVPDEITMG